MFGFKLRIDRITKTLLFVVLAVSKAANAEPSGGQIVGGQGSIEQAGNQTTVNQDTSLLSIDWDSFDVGVDEQVEFIQPGQDSVALNRILGTNGSEILGRIDANGHVILVNPNGIVFGKNATVNAGGLIASGLQINPEDFLNGDLIFKGLENTEGTVINSGFLNAAVGGNIALLGKRVENDGLIMANLGRVHMAAGQEAVLTFDASGLLGIQIDEATLSEELGDRAAVVNNGKITAAEGQILLNAASAKDVFANAVNWGDQQTAKSVVYHEDGSFSLGGGQDIVNTGELDVSGASAAGDVILLGENIHTSGKILADSASGNAGHIELLSNNTTELKGAAVVSASAEEAGSGGQIKLLGKNVGIFDQSAVKTTGANGGGVVLIGGDKTGTNTAIKNADFTYLGELAEVDASATLEGNGGKIILFAEDSLRSYGGISATGGATEGDGGFVETSGKIGFDLGRQPLVFSNIGVSGEWLIDPYNIDVIADLGTGIQEDNGIYTSTQSGARLRVELVINALDLGANITIQTGAGGAEQGNITVSAPIQLTSNTTSSLNLIAHNDIIINKNIAVTSDTGKLNLNLQANTSTLPDNQGSISFGAGVDINTNGGDFIIGDADTFGAYDVSFINAKIDLTGPDYGTDSLEFLAPSGRLFVHAQNDITLANASTSDPNVQPFYIKGTEREGDAPKLEIIAGNDVIFNGWLYDNNPTETAADGYVNANVGEADYANNSGYTTLRFEAGNDILLNQGIDFAYSTTDLRQLDRLHIRLFADADGSGGGDIIFGGNSGANDITLVTGGGDFIIENAVTADFSDDIINTTSPFGGGDIRLSASGDVNIGTVPFAYGPSELAPLRVAHVDVTAGGNITVGVKDFEGIGRDMVYSDLMPAPFFNLVADNNVTVTGSLRDTDDGDNNVDGLHLKLIADADGNNTGTLTLNANIYSGGGNIELGGNSIALSGSAAIDSDFSGNGVSAGASIGGDITIESATNITLNNVITDNDCGDLARCGALTIASRDPSAVAINVTQADGTAIAVNDRTVFDVGGGNIVLESTGNLFSEGVTVSSANTVRLKQTGVDANHNYAIGGATGSNIAGELTFALLGDGKISNDGPLIVAGAAQFSVANNDINLDNGGNDFQGAVFIAPREGGGLANNVVINDINDLVLGQVGQTMDINQTFTVNADGDVSQVGVIWVDGDTTFNVNGNDLTLDVNNRFTTLLIDSADVAVIRNAQNLTLQGFAATSIDLNVTGNITQATAAGQSAPFVTPLMEMAVTGAAQLTNTANTIDALSGNAGRLTLVNAADLTLGTFSVTGGGDSTFTLADGATLAIPSATVLSATGAGSIIANAQILRLGSSTPLATPPQITLSNNSDLTFNNVTDAFINATFTGSTSNSDVVFNGGDGDDIFVLGDNLTWDLNSFNLNAGTGSDQLQGNNVTSDWTLDNGQSTLDQTGQRMDFEGIETLLAGSAVDTFVVSGDTVNVIQMGDGDDSIEFTARALNLGVVGGEGEDRIQGAAGENRWLLGSDGLHQLITEDGSPAVTSTIEFSEMEILAGRADTQDQLTGTDSVTEWQINAANGGIVTPENGAGMTFSNIDSLVGGSGADTFRILDGASLTSELIGGAGDDIFYLIGDLGGNIDGGLGADTFYINNPAITVNISGGEEPADDNSVVDTVYGLEDQNTRWDIAADGTQSINGTIVMEDFERLQGSEFDDTFVFANGADITIQLDGGLGAGFDSLDYSEIGESLDVRLGSNLDAVSNIDEIVGNDLPDSLLTILDDFADPDTAAAAIADETANNNYWSINGANSGSVDVTRGSNTNSIQFSAFANVSGEAVADTFDLSAGGTLSNSIEGGDLSGGTNTLIGPDQNTRWEIAVDGSVSAELQDSATPLFLTASNIDRLQGGDLNDQFVFMANDSGIGANGGLGVDAADFSNISEDLLVELGSDSGSGLFGVENVETLIGNADGGFNSRITVVGTEANTWQVTGENTGTVSLGADSAIAFENFNQLVGGAGVDIFTLAADLVGVAAYIDGAANADLFQLNAPISADIFGGAGNDQFLLGATGLLSGQLDGGADNDTLQGVDQNVDWFIDDPGTGATVRVEALNNDGSLNATLVSNALAVENLVGGDGDDRFVFSANNTGVGATGGAGGDTVDYSGIATDLTVILGDGDVNGVSQVETVIGNNTGAGIGSLNSRLEVVGDIDNNWQVTQVNGGEVALGGGLGTIEFVGFNELVGGAGVDRFDISAGLVADALLSPGTILGGASADEFHLLADVGALRLDGEDGADQLTAATGTANYWLLEDPWSTLSSTAAMLPADSVQFRNMAVLVGAEDAADTLVLNDLTNVASIIAGDGVGVVDVIDYSGVATAVSIQLGGSGLEGFERISGNGALSTLTGRDEDSTWSVSAANAGSVTGDSGTLLFDGFANLTGGSGNDVFQLAALVSYLDGGDGNNQLDATSLATDLQLGIGAAAGQALNVDNIQTVSASGVNVNRLVSAAVDSAWTISGSNAGSLDYAGQTLTFSGFNQLEGSTNNQFDVTADGQLYIGTATANTPGSVIGGSGDNRLQLLADRAGVWQITGLNTGSVNTVGTDLGFNNVASLIGGPQDDQFNLLLASASVTNLAGGLGANSLTGFDQNNTWLITADNSGTLNSDLNFSQIQTVTGGTQEDQVTLNAGVQLTDIITGAGADRITLLAGAQAASIQSGNGADQIRLEDNAVVSGALASGNGNDTITLLANVQLGGVVDGGEQGSTGGDVLDLSAYGEAVDIAIAASAVADIVITGIEELIAPQVAGNTLRGQEDSPNNWLISALGAGTVENTGQTVAFSNIDLLVGGAQADQFVFAAVGSTAQGIVGGDGLDSVQSQSTANQWQLTGDNQIRLIHDSITQVIDGVESLVGGAGTDEFDFSLAPSASFTGSLAGGAGDDTLLGYARENEWQITTVDGGTVNTDLVFSQIENVIGGALQDRFVVLDGAYLSGVIDGRLPDASNPAVGDILDVQAFTGPFLINYSAPATSSDGTALLNIASIEQILTSPGHQGGIRAGDTDNEWRISGENSGTLNGSTFENFTSLVGGAGRDEFILEAVGSITGLADGAGGANAFTVTAADVDHVWDITGDGAGVLQRDNDGATVRLAEFKNIQTLTGAASNDQFIFADAGRMTTLHGGEGSDTLYLGNLDNQITLTSTGGSVVLPDNTAVTDFDGVDILYAGGGDDNITITANVAIQQLFAGAGSDVLDLAERAGDLSINLANGSTNIAVASSATLLNVQEVERFIANPSGNNVLTGYNLSSEWRLSEDYGGRFTFNVDAATTIEGFFSGFNALIGGNADDLFDLQGFALSRIDGAQGVNTMSAATPVDATADWTVVGPRSGQLLLQGDTDVTVAFTGMDNLIGGAGIDAFDIDSAGSLPGYMDGGAGGQDSLRYQTGNTVWQINGNTTDALGSITTQNAAAIPPLYFANIETFIAAGSDWLVGPDGNAEWTINDVGAGEIVLASGVGSYLFDGFTALLGGTGEDVFNIGDVTDIGEFVDGGAGQDSVIVTDGRAIQVFLNRLGSASGGTANSIRLANMESLVADNNRDNSLVGNESAEQGYTWSINGQYQGSVAPSSADSTESITAFSNFNTLYGGAKDDLYQISADGEMAFIDGGAGQDFIDYSNATRDLVVLVTQALDSVGGASISNVEGLVGNNDGVTQTDYQAILQGPNGINNWTFTSQNSEQDDGINDGLFIQLNASGDEVSRFAFRNFNRFVGGSGADTFVAEGDSRVTGAISGGGGQDQFLVNNWQNTDVLHVALLRDQDLVDLATFATAKPAQTYFLHTIETVEGNQTQSHLWGSSTVNDWQLQGSDRGQVAFDNQTVLFTQMDNLHGGDDVDNVYFDQNDTLSGWLTGGAGEDHVYVANYNGTARMALASDLGAALADDTVATLFNDLENLHGSAAGVEQLRVISSADVNWVIDGQNQGSVLGLAFDEIDQLLGAAGGDTFNVLTNGQVSGLIDGGEGQNVFNVGAIGRDTSISLGSASGVDFQVTRMAAINANVANNNTLLGANQANVWQINGENTGLINSTVQFTGFQYLTGGNQDDQFTILDAGNITGVIDGGAHQVEDVVDYSSITQQLDVRIGQDLQGLINIERIVGNEEMRLIGPNSPTTWSIDQGLNQGSLAYGTTQLSFSGVANIIGGTAVDTFNVNGGAISGGIAGGDGDDRLNYAVNTITQDRELEFNGNGGSDRITFTGGASDKNALSRGPLIGPTTADPLAFAAYMEFQEPDAQGGFTQSIRYLNVENVAQNAQVNTLRLNGTSNDDIVVLTTGTITANNHTPIDFKTTTSNVFLALNASDNIVVAEPFSVSNRLTVQNASVTASSADAAINAAYLQLTNIGVFGEADAPIRTSLGQLSLKNVAGPVYVEEQNALTLDTIDTRGVLSVDVLNGDLTQLQAITASADLNLSAANGSILLGLENQISGSLNLAAASAVVLNNAVDTHLNTVSAETLTVTSTGSLTGDGMINVSGQTSLQSNLDIQLLNPQNDFFELAIGGAQNVNIYDESGLSLLTSNVSGVLTLNTAGLDILGQVSAGSLLVDVGAGSLNQFALVSAANDVRYVGDYVNIEANLDGDNITLSGGQNGVLVAAPISARGEFTATGQQISTAEPINVSGSATLRADQLVLLGSSLKSQNDIVLDAVNGTINTSGVAVVEGRTLSLSGVDMVLNGQLTAEQIQLDASHIVTLNGSLRARVGDLSIITQAFTAGDLSQVTTDQGALSIFTQEVLSSGNMRSAQSLRLSSLNGSIHMNGAAEAATEVVIEAYDKLTISQDVVAQGDIQLLSANGDYRQQGTIRSVAGNVSLSSGNNIVMESGSLIQADVGNITLAQGHHIGLAALQAEQGTVSITATGAVSDNNGEGASIPRNVTALDLSIQAEAGVGANDSLETAVGDISIINTSGRVALNNIGELNVSALLTDGDIELVNDEDVTISSGSINAFYDADLPLDPRVNGVPTSTASVWLEITDGSLRTAGGIEINNPALSAYSATISAPRGDFGGPGVPPVIYTPAILIVAALRSWNEPIWGFGLGRPDYRDQSQLKTNINDISAGEQLVEVETLEEIDPAVFTAVKNYFYQDISILLPKDQRYDEEEYE